jgi:peptide/nickel transport system substrate-binding protein
MRRLWLSLAMLCAGIALLAAAQLGGAASGRQGGIFRYGTPSASDQIDPQLAHNTTAWWLEYATAAKLYNWSDNRGRYGHRLVPEVASKVTISQGGRLYTFHIRQGFRFSDGTPVTAASFKYAINRVANKDLASPGAQYITDPNATEIVGAKDVNEGSARDVSGVRVRGRKLIIELVDPDASFLTKLTMPFFQATSTKLPLDREVVNVSRASDLPAAGPYSYTRNEVNKLTSIRRNPYWKRGPGRMRPRHLAGLDVLWNLDEQTAFNQVKTGELDEAPIPSSEVQNVANKYGVNKTRFWAKSQGCVGWLAFNNSGGMFDDNVPMRKAVNWAIDRSAYVALAGPYAGNPWTHLLPPGLPGSITKSNRQPYGRLPNLAKARQLAAGHFKDGRIMVVYQSHARPSPQAQLIRRDLINLGFEPDKVEVRSFYLGAPPEWDLLVYGWCAVYPDPYNFFSPFLVRDALGFPYPSLYDPRYAAKIADAARLRGVARFKRFGELDLEIMRNEPPVVVLRTYNNRYFFSRRVDPKSLAYNYVYGDWSIPALALK